MILEILFFVLLGIVFIGAIGSRIYFVRTVDIEFEFFHDNWEADGKPKGGKESRKESSFWKSDFADISCLFGWLVYTPSWAMGHSEVPRLLIRMRICYSIFIVSMIALILTVNKLLGKP